MTAFPHKLAPMTRRATTLLVLVCALSIGMPAVAGAASSDTAAAAISDCNDHGQLTAQYSSDTLRSALAQMPADVREYTDCYDVIQRQLFAQLGQTQSGGTTTATTSSSSSFLPTWLIVVLVVLALAAVTFGALAFRRRAAEREAAGAGAGGPAGAPEGETAADEADAPTRVDEPRDPGQAGGPGEPPAT
jgi:TolA-binding protein